MQDSLSEAISKKIDSIANRNNMYHSGKVTKINNFIVEVVGSAFTMVLKYSPS